VNVTQPVAFRRAAVPGPALQAKPAVIRSPHGFATGIFLLYIFLLASRAVEMLPGVFGINPRLMVFLLPVCLLAAIIGGGLVESLKTPVVLLLSVLTGWFLIATVSSQWRGGSAQLIVFSWSISFLTALLVPSLISDLRQCRKMFYTLGFALLPILFTTVVFRTEVQGRDAGAFGSLGNPNDLAFAMMLLIPFAVFVIQSVSLLNWKGVVCILATGLALVLTLRTGSRAAVLTIAVCFLIVLAVGKAKTKMKLLLTTALVAVLAMATVSSAVFLRYTTVFNGTSVDAGMSVDELSAVESTRARKMLFEESIRLMFEHPLLGVGPGIFSVALAGEQKEKGEFQTWHEAHNSFSQMGSEAGIPAVLICFAILFYCFKRTITIYYRSRRDPKRIATTRMAAALFMALVVFTTCAAFGNYAYSFHLPLLAGLVQAFDIAVRKSAKAVPAALPVRQPVPGSSPRHQFAGATNAFPSARPFAGAANSSPSRRPIAQAVNARIPTYVRNRRLPDSRV
jgi:O-antigen ligase